MATNAADYNLAIEMSVRRGEIAIGRGGHVERVERLPEPHRHKLELIPTIDSLCQRHGIAARNISRAFVSVGPGSFTGLRIAISAAKMLALAGDVKLVAVPTLDAMVRSAPDDARCVAVGASLKRGTLWSRAYRRIDDHWEAICEPGLRTVQELIDLADPEVCLLGDPLGDVPDDVRILPAELARPRAAAVYELGWAMAQAGHFTAAASLLPLYAREPEAVALWQQREREP